MSLGDYRKTIEELCVQAGIANVSVVLHHGALKFQGHAIRLEYCEDGDLCRLMIDLGAPTGPDLASLYLLLLEANVGEHTAFIPVHGIHPSNGHVVLILHVPLRRLQTDVNLFQLLTSSLDEVFEAWSDVLKEGAGKRTEPSVDLLSGCNLA